jgi:Flp pilus assembly protein protease CpaA
LQMRSAMLRPWVERGPAWVGRLATSGDAPYGLAIAVGGLITLPRSPLLAAIGG